MPKDPDSGRYAIGGPEEGVPLPDAAGLRDSDRMLATLLSNLPGMAYRCRNDSDWTMEFVSEGCRELTGYGTEDLIGNRRISFEQIIHPEDRAQVRGEVDQALKAGRRFELTYRIITAAGIERWVLEHGMAVTAPDSSVRFLEGIITDISARKSAETALAGKEHMLGAILDHSLQFIGLLDPAGRLLRANQTSLDAVAVSREDVQGHFYWDTAWWVHSVAEQQRLREAVARAAQGEFVRYETTHRAADGRMLTVDFSLKPVRDVGGQVVALIPEGRDITDRKNAERALRESEDKFAKAFRSSPDAILLVELETGRILEINDGVERAFGYTREEVVGRTTIQLNMWADQADRVRMVEIIRRDGRVRDLRFRGLYRGRTPFTCLFSSEKIEIAGVMCTVSVVRDITEQVRAEEALRESEEKFAKAFRASPDAISVSDFATGRIIDVNETFERLFGFTRAELIDHTSDELGLWPVAGDLEKLREELRLHGRVREMQFTGRPRSGESRQFQMSAELVEIGGRPCMIVLGRDISESLKAEQALRESEEKFAKTFRSSPYAVTITELDTGCYLDVNWGFERMSGYSRDQVLGKNSLEVGIWHNPADREELMRRLRGDARIRGMEIKFRTRLGEVLVTRCSCDVVELGGKPCMLAVIEDITEQRKAEDARAEMEQQFRQVQKLEALGQLAGGIAHDFNNILTGILAYSELAVMDATDPQAVGRHLAEVGKAGRRARDLVRQILAFSRQQVKSRAPIRLHPVVQEVISLLRSSLPSSIEIKPYADPEAPIVLADATQIHQIVMNLCTNSAHAMRDRQGVLSIRLQLRQIDGTSITGSRRLLPGRYAVLTVADNGHGMDAAVLKRSFEPFFTTKGPGEGTGLGLSVVHGIVEDHDGAVLVDSVVGKGTTFEIYFPEHIALTASNAAEPVTLGSGKGERILFVDDEAMIADSACKLLERFGYQVTAKTDPRAALLTFEADPAAFDLVVTDLTMPGLSGIDVARQILSLRPDLPVLLASGYNGTWTPEKVRELGLRTLINKPLTTSALVAAVRTALDEVYLPTKTAL